MASLPKDWWHLKVVWALKVQLGPQDPQVPLDPLAMQASQAPQELLAMQASQGQQVPLAPQVLLAILDFREIQPPSQ